MAKEKNNIGLLKNLTFAPEARTDGGVSQPIESGRFRYFFSTFRQNNGLLMLTNLLFLVTVLPLIAVFIIIRIVGVEELGYWLHKVTEAPYLLSGVGIGISGAASAVQARVDMLDVYAWAFLFAGLSLVVMSIGLSGFMPVCVKFIWKDSFVCKKDSYGNDVPRVVVEFFKGIKKYWWQMLIAGAFLAIIVAGVGNVYVFFLSKYWLGAAGGGEWVLLIFATILALFGAMFCLRLIPTIVLYDIGFGAKLKNAAIMTLQMFLQNLFVLIAVAAPVAIICATDGFINIILTAALLVFGGPFYCLTLANYEQYFAEKIITPVYQAQFAKSKKNKKKHKK